MVLMKEMVETLKVTIKTSLKSHSQQWSEVCPAMIFTMMATTMIYDHDIVDDNFDGIDDKMIATLKVKMKDEPEVS